MKLLPARVGVVLLALAVASVTSATTVVAPTDPGELAFDSGAVFLARAGTSVGVQRAYLAVTETKFEVMEVVKGSLRVGERVVVQVPGGTVGEVGWLVAGSPGFTPGQVYLVFADRRGDGVWQLRLLADSVLRRVAVKDGSAVLVPLEESAGISRVSPSGPGAALVPGPVKERRFIEALELRLHGVVAWDWNHLLVDAESGTAPTKDAPNGCVFMDYEGDPIRWKRFDSGRTITMSADRTGDADLAGGGFTQIQNALARWNSVSGTSVSVAYGGLVDPFDAPDACKEDTTDAVLDAVLFGDPCEEMATLSGCSGTLAIGGPSFYTSTYTWDSRQWHEAVHWFVVVNDGVGACVSASTYELILTHEMGHGLGFGHVAAPDALMYQNCCHPHSALDNQCTQYLYPQAAATTPTPTRTPTRTPTVGAITPTPTPTRTPTRTPTSASPSPSPTPGSGAPVRAMVPVVVHADGVGGTAWRSDVVVTNRNARAQQLRLTYRSTDTTSRSVIRSLPGFATLLMEDLVASVFGAGDGRGPLQVEAVTSGTVAPAVVSRAYAENPFGNLGSGVPSDLAPSTAVVSMPGLFHDWRLRTNIAVTAGDDDVVATFELFRGVEGLVKGGVTRQIGAHAQDQWTIAQLFRGYALDGVPMTVRVSLDRPGVVYASLVDNASTDSAVYAGTEPAANWVIPVVARLPGAEGTFWSSSVSLWNASGSVNRVDLEFLPERTNNSAGGLHAPFINLAPYASVDLDDVLYDNFGIDDSKGVLVVDAARPVTVTSRVFTEGPRGGASGNGVRAVWASAFSAAASVLPGVRVAEGFRTNVGLVTADAWVNFVVDLNDGDGSLLARRSVAVPPRTLRQWSVEQLFGVGARPPDPVGSVVVTADAPYLAYLTVIDGTSQDPVFIMPK